MKTTKKGFTLIELIVVIAIIGVLAAILVPAMLGYVKKSKIQSANSAAATILKACNSALAEMDEVDLVYNGTGNGTITVDGSISSTNPGASDVVGYMESYFDGAKTAHYKIQVENSVAIYCAAKSGAYYGTSPAHYTAKNYPATNDLGTAFTAASTAYTNKKS